MHPQRDPLVLTIPAAAELLGISTDLAYDLARRNELPGAVHLGRRWVVSRPRLMAWLGVQDSVIQHAS